MGEEKIRVGIVGAGANTRSRHIPGLQALDDVEIVSVCNRSRASSERVAEESGIPRVYDHWRQVVEDGKSNAIVIGTWPYLHCPVTLAALEANKHVLCEARMAMNATEARRMRDAGRAKPQLVTQIVPSPLSLRVDRTISKLISDGYLGDILAVEVRSADSFLDAEAPLHWRHDADLSGYNVMSLGILYEAVMRWVGPARLVQAMGKTFVTSRVDGDGRTRSIRVPDHLDVLADMECGAQARFWVSSVIGDYGLEAYLFGSNGTLRFAGNKLFGGVKGETELQEIPIPAELEGGWRVEEEFVSAIRGREPITHTSFDTGLKYMEFTEAVALSMADGRAVAIPV